MTGILLPAITKIFIDNYLIGERLEWGKPTLFILTATIGIVLVLMWLQQRTLLRLESKLTLYWAINFFWQILCLPIELFSRFPTGDLYSRVEANQTVARLLSSGAVDGLTALLTVAVFSIAMVSYNVELAAVAIATLSITAVALLLSWQFRRNARHHLVDAYAELSTFSIHCVSNIEFIKANGDEADCFARWAEHEARYVALQLKLGARGQLLAAVPMFLNGLAAALVLTIGAGKVIEGAITIGELVAFQMLMISCYLPIRQLVDLSTDFQQTTVQLSRIEEIENARNFIINSNSNYRERVDYLIDQNIAKLRGHVELWHVTFGYGRLDTPIIKNFNLQVRPGACVAIVGPSGSGKSTLAKILAGLYSPWTGGLYFDGIECEAFSRETRANSIGFVDQDICLFSGTVRENISLWDDRVDDRAIIKSARDACIHDVIARRPQAYMGPVLEHGRNLSRGEAQRLEIARVLARDPSILILDEATALLDASVEKEIFDNIRRRGCTCILIAHRLSAIRDCEEIVVVSNGQVVEQGTHSELCAKDGFYVKLLDISN